MKSNLLFAFLLICFGVMFAACDLSSSSSNQLPTVTTKYGIDLSSVSAFDSVTVDIVVDGAAQEHRVYTIADVGAGNKIRWDVVAPETKVAKLNVLVWYQGRIAATQSETFASGQAPQIPSPILAPTVILPTGAIAYNEQFLHSVGINVSATSNSTSAYITSIALDLNSDGVVDTSVSGGSGVASLAITNANMHGTVTGGIYTATATVTDVLGRSFSYTFLVNGVSGLGPVASFTDSRNGNVYTYRRIGSQTWMTQNLNYAYGTSWCYNDDPSSCALYGRLYDWTTATSVCPAGWHLPSNDEGLVFSDFVKLINQNGFPLVPASGWNDGDGSPVVGSDVLGFSALPAGEYSLNLGGFAGFGSETIWWSSTDEGGDGVYFGLSPSGFGGGFGAAFSPPGNGYSVRCLQDAN